VLTDHSAEAPWDNRAMTVLKKLPSMEALQCFRPSLAGWDSFPLAMAFTATSVQTASREYDSFTTTRSQVI
jgi:hypothetical protein